MATIDDKTALIIIDVQQGLDDPRLGERSNPDAEENMARLLAEWRRQQRTIYHIQHMSTEANSPLLPDLPGNAIKAIVAPQADEPVIQKQVNNAFVGTDLEARLRSADLRSLVIIGLTTDHCVSTTVRMACDLGYETVVVVDATATHERHCYDGKIYSAQTVHELALANLHQEFATVLTTDQVLFMA